MENYEDVADSIAYWRDVLQLNHYIINVNEAPAPEEAVAEMQLENNRRYATIRLAANFFQLEEQEQEMAIVHELLHIVTLPVQMVALNLSEHLSREYQEMLLAATRREMEIANQHLTEVLFDLEKLVPDKKPDKSKKKK